MWTLALVLSVPYVLALILTPLFIRAAERLGTMDAPDGRKRHAKPVALLGGLAVLASAVGGLCVSFGSLDIMNQLPQALFVMGVGASAMAVLGLVDDLRDLRAGTKLAFQLGIAVLTWVYGVRIGEMELPFGWFVIDAWVPSLVLTVLWIVLISNAFNLIDGIDGLATGIGLITMLTMFVVAMDGAQGPPRETPLVALAVAGALAGFLRFNLPSARIFLGDCGALAIGYVAAVLSIGTYQKSATAMVIVVPLLAIGVPVVDLVVAALRRLLAHVRERGVQGLGPRAATRAIFAPDREHIHFLLLRLGLRPTAVLALLYGASGVLAGLALWTRSTSANLQWGILIGSLSLGFVAVRLLEHRVGAEEPLPTSRPAPAAHTPPASSASTHKSALG